MIYNEFRHILEIKLTPNTPFTQFNKWPHVIHSRIIVLKMYYLLCFLDMVKQGRGIILGLLS